MYIATLYSAPSGLAILFSPEPRALPWAITCHPVGVEDTALLEVGLGCFAVNPDVLKLTALL
jgi:hypothetical protein